VAASIYDFLGGGELPDRKKKATAGGEEGGAKGVGKAGGKNKRACGWGAKVKRRGVTSLRA